MHDSLKGFLATLLFTGMAFWYIATLPMTNFTSLYAMPLVCALTVICMPNVKWLAGSMAVYVLPATLLAYGLLSSEDMNVGGALLLADLFVLTISVIISAIIKFIILKLMVYFRNSKHHG